MTGRLLGVLAALLAGLGCAAFGDPMGRASALEDAQLHYTQHVRWGNLDAASEFVDPALREAFLSQAPAFEAVRITDFEIGRIDYGDDRDSATVRVTYRAYSLASLEEQRIEERQHWVRPGGNTWFVRPQLAGLLEPFPGVGR
jgi:hypothetical protein